jgi:hypothetical protein
MRSLSFLVLFFAVLGHLGCRGANPTSESIDAAVASGPGTRLALADYAAFPWEKACIFGPYSPDDKVDAVTGIRGAASRAYDIRSNDGINVVMFIHDGEVVASVAHPRNRGDCGPEVVGQCYSRERSVFVVRIPPTNSWGNIGPT